MKCFPSVRVVPRRDLWSPRVVCETSEKMELECANGETIRVTDDSEHYELAEPYFCAKYVSFLMPTPEKTGGSTKRKDTSSRVKPRIPSNNSPEFRKETKIFFFSKRKLADGNHAAEEFAVVHSNFPYGHVWIGQIRKIYDPQRRINDVDKFVWHGRGIQFPYGADTIYEGNWDNGKEIGDGKLHLLDEKGIIVHYKHVDGKRVEDVGDKDNPKQSRFLGNSFPTFANFPLVLRLIMVAETKKTRGGEEMWKVCSAFPPNPEEVEDLERISKENAEKRKLVINEMDSRERAMFPEWGMKQYADEFLNAFPKQNVDLAKFSKKHEIPTPDVKLVQKCLDSLASAPPGKIIEFDFDTPPTDVLHQISKESGVPVSELKEEKWSHVTLSAKDLAKVMEEDKRRKREASEAARELLAEESNKKKKDGEAKRAAKKKAELERQAKMKLEEDAKKAEAERREKLEEDERKRQKAAEKARKRKEFEEAEKKRVEEEEAARKRVEEKKKRRLEAAKRREEELEVERKKKEKEAFEARLKEIKVRRIDVPTPRKEDDSEDAKKKEKKENEIPKDDPLTCGICMDRRRNLVFGCGHTICKDCAENLTDCPYCRAKITERRPLFI